MLTVLSNPAESDRPADAGDNCHTCVHRRSVPGSCHIRCADPDPAMRCVAHGVRGGWFGYPLNFDPVWKARVCSKYQAKEGES